MALPEAVAPVGPPPSAAGNWPPIARSKMTKKPCWVALAQVPGCTPAARTVWNCTPTRYPRSCAGLVDRSHSIAYVWKSPWQVAPLHGTLLPRPVFSLHGPPGLTPQWKVAHSRLMPLTFSMMSISPTLGQFHRLPRYGAPSIQNAGQYPAAAAPVTSGIWTRASTCSLPPAGGWKSSRLVSMRPDVQPPLFTAVMRRLPLPSRDTFCGLDVMVSTSSV